MMPLRADGPAKTVTMRWAESELAELEAAAESLGVSRSELTRTGALDYARRRLAVIEGIEIEQIGIDRCLVSWPGGGMAIVRVAYPPGRRSAMTEPVVETLDGDWPDAGIEAEATRRVVERWESEPHADL